MKVKCINNNYEEPHVINGKPVCMATHPKTPNRSGHSRGRKVHLAKNETHTVCNMLVDGYIPASDLNWQPMYNGKCKVCFKS